VSDKPTVFEIFADVKREVRAVGKDSRNATQGFNFRGIDAVVNAAAPALDKHGVITATELESIAYATVEVGQKRTPMAHVRVEVTYRFYGPGGDSFPVKVPGEAMDSGDKGTAKAMSVAYRIALLQALNLPTSEPDPDSQSYERSGADASREDDSWRDAPSESSRPWADRQPETARAKPPAQGASGEDEWVLSFLARVADADETAVRTMRVEVAKAVQAQKITPQVGNELNQALKERAEKIRNAA
jgi:ERF superfamily